MLSIRQTVRAIACTLFLCVFFASHVRAQESNADYWSHERARTGHGNIVEHHAGHAASRLIAEARKYLGRGKFTPYPGPWCADAVTAWLRATGHRTVRSRLARDMVHVGKRLHRPEPGAVMVLPHHTGIVVAVHGSRVLVISGNHGGRVAESLYPISRAIAFVRPT